MTQPEFSVHLGGGLYMDSAGVLSHGPEPGKPVYPAAGGGLPIDPNALAKAFQGLAKALPDKDDPKSREKFDKVFDGIGMADADKENLIGVLQAACAVASVIGSVVPIVGAALAVLTLLLGLFKEGPSALELMITRRFDQLERTIKALEIQIQQRDLRNQRNVISAALAALNNYVVELHNTPPNEAALMLRRQDVRTQVKDAGAAVRNLLDTTTWLAGFDTNEYKWVWPWMSHRLFTFPSAGPPQRAPVPQQGDRFDHRLMVPLAMFGVTGFLAILRASAPEFRSTRQNREDLWDFADALDRLVENMRREGLARTLYTPADFQGGPGGGIPWGLDPAEVDDASIFGLAPRLAEGNTRFAVGALDLCSHNDGYFTPGFTASRIQHPGPQYAKQGLLNVRWMPPAKLESYYEQVPTLGWEPANQAPPTRRRYRIANPEECAQAANAQSERDFADLLYSSGYLNLLHLVAMLRNEATDPDRSQTVRSEAWLRRQPGPLSAVVVESVPILLTGVISADAEKQPQQYKATTWFTTQPLGRDRQLRYRVWLRTLHGESDYRQNYHQVGYTNDPAHPHAQKLFTSTGTALDEVMIAEGISVPELRETSKTVALKATTYESWVPVKPFGHPRVSAASAAGNAVLHAEGWEPGSAPVGKPASPPTLPTPGGGQSFPIRSSVGAYVAVQDETQLGDFIGWLDGEEPAKVQHRLVHESQISLDYTVRWQADELAVSLRNNRPDDRNYVVYVVVEETLGSGEVLHTFERVPVTGQLTFVPQSFFDEESAALAKTARFFRAFAERYAKSLSVVPRHGGPGDPDPDWLFGLDREILASDPVLRELELADSSTAEDFTRLATVIARHPPAAAVLREVLGGADVPQSVRAAMISEIPSAS